MPDPAILVVSPNWLGDAVMALPAIQDVRRRFGGSRLIVAARSSVASLFELVPGIDHVVTLEWRGRFLTRAAMRRDSSRLRNVRAGTTILLTNSFATAWLVKKAGIAERWGYATDLRRPLLTRAISRPSYSVHQGAYYQYLTRELGIGSGPLEPEIVVSDQQLQSGRELLLSSGWNASRPLVVMAPGAAYGTAKRWLPSYVADVIVAVTRQNDAQCVLVGSAGDLETAMIVRDALPADALERVIDLTGRTSLDTLAAILSMAAACVSNDSGAMHLAAAAGAPVAALFGPTREYETAPLPRAGRRADVLINPVWCRPCMLRECPIDHRCMRGLKSSRVFESVIALMDTTDRRHVPQPVGAVSPFRLASPEARSRQG
jgi:heptosyltransferase-2